MAAPRLRRPTGGGCGRGDSKVAPWSEAGTGPWSAADCTDAVSFRLAARTSHQVASGVTKSMWSRVSFEDLMSQAPSTFS